MINMRKLKKSINKAQKEMNKVEKKTREYLEEGFESSAKTIMDGSIARVPVDEGYLEDAHYYEVDTSKKDIEARVGLAEDMEAGDALVGDYNVWIHEGHYKLGKKSLQKQASSSVKVGRKFLERSYLENINEISNEMSRRLKEYYNGK